MKFLDELNTKHGSIKFQYKISKATFTFLDTEAYTKNNKLYTQIYRKQNKTKKQIVKHSSTSTLNNLNI